MNLGIGSRLLVGLFSSGQAVVVAGTPVPGNRSRWQGSDCYDFTVNGTSATVVAPRTAPPGKPWARRGQFFGAFADAALVDQGFHLANLSVPELLGSADAA